MMAGFLETTGVNVVLCAFELRTTIAFGLFFAFVEAAAPVCAAAEMSAMETVTERARISPNEVTFQNLEAFQAQMRDDLPPALQKRKSKLTLIAGLNRGPSCHSALVDSSMLEASPSMTVEFVERQAVY